MASKRDGDQDATTEAEPTKTSSMLLHAIVALCIVAAAIVGVNMLFSSAPKVAKRKRPPRRAILVEVASAKSKTVALEIRASGLSTAAQRLELIPQISGKITTLSDSLVPGKIVKKGTVLATIERRDYQLAVARAQSTVAQANASLSLESGNQDLAKLESKYLKDLVTEDNRDLVLRQPQLATAKASLAAARVALQQARLDLSRTRIVAPFDAVVLTRDVSVGRTVTLQSPIATLAGIDAWWLRAEVPVETLAQLKPGASATVSLPSVWGNKTRTGTIMQTQGQVESQGRLGFVLIEVVDPLSQNNSEYPPMLLGMRFEVRLVGTNVSNAVSLKPGWIRGEDSVWLMGADDKLDIKTVVIAQRSSDTVVVQSGLRDGDRIITSRLASPVQGMKLRLESESPPTGSKSPRGGKPKGAGASPKAKQ